MAVQKLKLPLPWGNQPDAPCDDPISWIVSDYLERDDCLAGYRRNPPIPCILGESAECAWGIRSPADFFCMWKRIARCSGEGLGSSELADILGVSKERARKLVAASQESAKCQLEKSELAEDYGISPRKP